MIEWYIVKRNLNNIEIWSVSDGRIYFHDKKSNGESAVGVIESIVKKGIYSTNLNITKNYWGAAHEGTFSDFLSMKTGDNVYFFPTEIFMVLEF